MPLITRPLVSSALGYYVRSAVPIGLRVALVLPAIGLILAIACQGQNGGAGTPAPTRTMSSTDGSRPAATLTAIPKTSPTPGGTSTPASKPNTAATEQDGTEGFRAFASQVQQALARRDADLFVQRAILTTVTCTAADVRAGFLPCSRAGETVRGIPVATYQSEGTLAAPRDFERLLVRYFGESRPDLSDQWGSGKLTLYALGQGKGNQPVFWAFTTAIVDSGGQPRRQVYAFAFVFQEGRWQLRSTTSAFASLEHLLSEQCISAAFCATWERWQG